MVSMVKIMYRAQGERVKQDFTEMEVRDLGGPREAAKEFVSDENFRGDTVVIAKELGCWPRILFRKTVDELRQSGGNQRNQDRNKQSFV